MSFDFSRPATWFRMYAEFASDPKVQVLTETLQRRYVMLLCLRCVTGTKKLSDTEIACYLRISDKEWLESKQSLLQEGLINKNGQPVSWDKRQFQSDVSTERVRAYRKNMKRFRNVSETEMKRFGNGPETETETKAEAETRAEEEPNTHTVFGSSGRAREFATPEFERFWNRYPVKIDKREAIREWYHVPFADRSVEEIITGIVLWQASGRWDEERFIPSAAKFLKMRRWESTPPKKVKKKDLLEELKEVEERLGIKNGIGRYTKPH